MKMNVGPTCKCSYKANMDDISKFELNHPSGEQIIFAKDMCVHCESLHLPVHLNDVSFEVEIPDEQIKEVRI